MNEIRELDSVTLEALYNLNKHAKKYGRLADQNYRRGKGGTARTNSLKKKALYGVKSRAVNRFLLDGDDALRRVERHEINGDPFLCLYFADDDGVIWSFHQPEDDVFQSRFPSRISVTDRPTEDFADFESGEEKDRSDLSLKASLLHLEACGINANDYLEETHVSYGSSSYFAGWPYLGDGGKRTTATAEVSTA